MESTPAAAIIKADVIQGAGDHHVEYFGGWIVSAAMAMATVLSLWHCHI
jgi:hypothetical protein